MFKKIFSPFLLSVVFLVFSAGGAGAETNSVALYLEASKFESSGEYVKAADIISEMLTDEKSAHLYSKLAELLISAGEDQRALDSLLTAEKEFPAEPYFKFLLGQLYEFYKREPANALKFYMKGATLSVEPKYLIAASRASETAGDFKTSLDIINKMIEKNPGLSDYYADRGRVYQKLNRLDKSIADLKKAIEIDSNLPAMLRLADIYLSQDDKSSAKKILEKIAEQKSDFIIPELKLGDIYKSEKDYVKAIELYSQLADKLNGKDRAAVLKQLGILQYETGDMDNASVSFQWAMDLAPEDPSGAYYAGAVYEFIGKKEEAKEAYETALKYNPKYAQVLKRMAAMNIIDKKADEAQKYLKNIDPVEYDVDYYLLLSESYSEKKDYNKAAISLIDGLNTNPTDTTILYALAIQYEYLKERDKALDTVKKAVSIQPENPVLLNFLGYIYADMGINLDEAFILISRALEKDPNNAAYLDSLGWVYFKQKNYKKAIEFIEKAYKLMPEDPEIKEHMEKIKKTVK